MSFPYPTGLTGKFVSYKMQKLVLTFFFPFFVSSKAAMLVLTRWHTHRRDDVLRAVSTLKPLGSSYTTIKVGTKPYIRSVPKELNTDQSAVLEAVQVLGYVTVQMLMVNLRWRRARAQTVLEDLVAEGMLWLAKDTKEWEYWTPSVMIDSDGVVISTGP